MNRIVDASVVVKWLVPEPGSERAAELMRHPVMAPDTLVPECLNALRKKVVRGQLHEDDARAAASILARAGITFESTQPLAEEILALSMRLSYPAYDCAYLAMARKFDGVVITADQRLVSRCRQPDAADLARRVQALSEAAPMVQERVVRPYMARRKAGCGTAQIARGLGGV